MPGTFHATTQIFHNIDNVTTQFIAENLSKIISTVTPWVALGLTIALMIEGISMMASPSGEPMSGLVKRFIRYAVIISIASAGGWYQTNLAQAALKIPDEFANVLVIDGKTANQQDATASVIDNALSNGMTATAKAWEGGSIFSSHGLMLYALSAAIIIVTLLMCALGAGLILMAKFMLGITVCFGPIFIFCLLFDSLKNLFTKWMGSLINYMLVTVLLSAVFGMMMEFFNKAVEAAMHPTADVSMLPITITCALITVVTWFVMKAVPQIAASWGDGVAAFARLSLPKPKPKSNGGGGAGGGAGGAAEGAGAGGAAAGAAGAAAAGAAAGGAAVANEVGGAMQGMARGSRR